MKFQFPISRIGNFHIPFILLTPQYCGSTFLFIFSQTTQIELNGILQSEREGIADQCMSDGYFEQTRNVLVEVGQVLPVQIMSSVQSQTEFSGPERSLRERSYSGRTINGEMLCEGFGVEFNALGTGIGSKADLFRIRTHE